MSYSVTRTFRVFQETSSFIDQFAQEQDVSYGEALSRLLKYAQHYLLEKQLDDELEFSISNKKQIKEDTEWADLELTNHVDEP